MAKEPQLYEIGLLIKPDLTEEQAAAELGNVRLSIEKMGGMMESTTDPKMRRLSYPIKKISQAYFAALQFSMVPGAIGDIGKDVDSNEYIMRHLVLSWTRAPVRPVLRRQKRTVSISGISPAAPQIQRLEQGDVPEEKIDEKELDKKLDEILGN
jgi:ribosomal protein S6